MSIAKVFAILALIGFSGRCGALAEPSDGPARVERPAVEVRGSRNYKRIVESTPWTWSDERANILESLSTSHPSYDVELFSPRDDPMRLKIRIMKGAKETYAWWGHKYSTFRVVGDRLYFVSFDIVSPGGTVLAVDLLTGKTLWQSELPPAGYPGHSFYRNRVILNADEETVSIYGNETGGRYFELKSAKTGKSLGRKTFDPAVDVKVSKP